MQRISWLKWILHLLTESRTQTTVITQFLSLFCIKRTRISWVSWITWKSLDPMQFFLLLQWLQDLKRGINSNNNSSSSIGIHGQNNRINSQHLLSHRLKHKFSHRMLCLQHLIQLLTLLRDKQRTNQHRIKRQTVCTATIIMTTTATAALLLRTLRLPLLSWLPRQSRMMLLVIKGINRFSHKDIKFILCNNLFINSQETTSITTTMTNLLLIQSLMSITIKPRNLLLCLTRRILSLNRL